MYEETKSSIDWKGLFLKVIIAFLIVLIAIKGYTTLKGDNKKVETTTNAVSESKSSMTFTENIEKLRNAGETYFNNNKDKLPKSEGTSVMVTLKDLISGGNIEALSDEDGKICDEESSYVTATLEGSQTKIKSNLVCGDASSYNLVYMDKNEEDNTTTSTSSNNNSTVTKSSTTNGTTNNSCNSTSCGTGTVSVSANATATQKISINSGSGTTSSNNNNTNGNSSYNPSNNTNTNYNYTTDSVRVSFDSNGGNTQYGYQRVKIGDTATNPGNTKKSGYTFKGWYLNGYKYDFSSPVNNNITLVAEFSDDRDYDRDYEKDYDRDYDYETDKEYTYVYTMGWDTKGTDYINITHTLRLPEVLEDNRRITRVKISDIDYYKPINTMDLANKYSSRHADTFFYTKNDWESNIINKNQLSTIKSAKFQYSSRYKDIYDASHEGFEVTWIANNVYTQCKTAFSINGEDNKCNYGIVYKVTWEYQY